MQKKKFGMVGGILALVLLGMAACIWHLNRMPVVHIPPQPAPPTPNAFDYFVQANGVLQDNNSIRLAATLTEKQRYVQMNAPALAAVRQGVPYRYGETYVRSWTTIFPHYGKFRTLALLLESDAEVKAARGDWRGATAANLDAVAMGVKIPHGGLLLSMLVGVAVESIGMYGLRKTLPQCDARTAADAARRLEALQTERIALADVMQEDAYCTRAVLQDTFQQVNWRTNLYNLVNGIAPQSSNKSLGEYLAEFVQQLTGHGSVSSTNPNSTGLPPVPVPAYVSKREIMRQCVQYQDAVIAETRKPYPLRKNVPQPPLKVCQALMPVLDKACNKYALVETQHHFFTVEFALRAYHLQHGAYPASLQALTPRYLNAVPADPYTAHAPLRYHRTPTTYVLYSVGPDGQDNNGTPSPDGRAAGPPPYPPNTSSTTAATKGDIVAGINVR